MSRIFYIASKEMPGVNAVGRHGEECGNWKRFMPEQLEKGHRRKISSEDLVIFGAWSERYPLLMRRLRCKKARLVTSSLGQMEFSPMEIEHRWLEYDFNLLEKGELNYILFGSRDAYEVYKDIDGVKYFPYPVHFLNPAGGTELSHKDDAVGLFICAVRKNIKNQTAAVRIVQRDMPCTLVTNERKWIPQDRYRTVLSRLKAVLFVSHTESFGYTAIDALQEGTLVIYSPCVRDAIGLSDELCVDNPDSAMKIADKIKYVLWLDESEYNMSLREQWKNIYFTATRNNQELKKLLEELLERT